MLEKKKIYEAVITDYTAEGQGVAKIEGCAVFIPNAISGERCLVRIEKVGKTWAAGKIAEILEKSPHRVQRECPISASCGGCVYRYISYERELELKQQIVYHAFRKAGLTPTVERVVTTGEVAHYRNKAEYPIAMGKNGLYGGFYAPRTHRVVPAANASQASMVFFLYHLSESAPAKMLMAM